METSQQQPDALNIWITYHDESQIKAYHLQEDDVHRLFKGNDVNVKGENINHLNSFYSELVTLYWVWKNNVRSKNVGFCHYRRLFGKAEEVMPGHCKVLYINPECPVFLQYKLHHNYQDMCDVIDILREQYGDDNKYMRYLLESKTFIPFCCFIMHWDDFNGLCNFLFPVLFSFDQRHSLDIIPDNYISKAMRDFRYDNIAYKRRAVAYLAERLISCYIVCNLKYSQTNAIYL